MVAILDKLAEHGSVGLTDLVEDLGVSPATLRRDLADLADRRLLLRTHGGATSIESHGELPVPLRDARFHEAKLAIAREVASLIPRERRAIALSGGSTTAAVARALSTHPQLTIVTNSLPIAELVTSYPQMQVIMTGGLIRHQSLELVGVLAEHTFQAINVATAILGTDGITAAGGVTTHDETEARTNLAMVTHAQRTIVVTDGSKIGRLAMAKVADIGQIHMLVTDDSCDLEERRAIEQAGVDVRLVPS